MALTVSATDTEAQKPVNVIYNQVLLENARPLCPYLTGSMPGSISEGAGSSTIKWRRWNTSADNSSAIAPSTTALSELTGEASYMQARNADTSHFTDVTATVAKYGQFFVLNEEVDTFLPNGTMAGISRSLGITSGRALNYLHRNTLEDNATLVYAGNVASDGVVASAASTGGFARIINTLVKNSAMPFTPLSGGSQNIGSSPVLPGLWAITHPDVAYDISNFTGFTSVEKYASHTQTAPGEFGTWGVAGMTVRCIQTPEASVDADSGASIGSYDLNGTSSVDLYTTVVFGEQAHGSVGVGSRHGDGIFRAGDSVDSIELITKPFGSGGTSDPFNEVMTMAFKFWYAGAVLNGNWLRGYRTGASNLTN